MTAPTKHDLTVMVDAAARAERSRQSAHTEPWDQIPETIRELYREDVRVSTEAAASVLPELGWVRQRTITTIEELDSLNVMTVIRDDQQFVLEKMTDANNGTGWYCTADPRPIPAQAVDLPAVVLYEPEPQP